MVVCGLGQESGTLSTLVGQAPHSAGLGNISHFAGLQGAGGSKGASHVQRVVQVKEMFFVFLV